MTSASVMSIRCSPVPTRIEWPGRTTTWLGSTPAPTIEKQHCATLDWLCSDSATPSSTLSKNNPFGTTGDEPSQYGAKTLVGTQNQAPSGRAFASISQLKAIWNL